MSSPAWVALLGGTFDPVHRGHLGLVRAALAHPRVDEVRLVPSPAPPHKPQGASASFEQRVAMCRIACRELRGASVWEIEKDRPGPSYTIDTLAHAAPLVAPKLPVFLMGADSLIDLPSWHQPERLLECWTVLVVPRPGYDLARVPATLLERVQLLTMEPSDASSTRARALAGGARNALVTPGVDRYIRSHGIYGATP